MRTGLAERCQPISLSIPRLRGLSLAIPRCFRLSRDPARFRPCVFSKGGVVRLSLPDLVITEPANLGSLATFR